MLDNGSYTYGHFFWILSTIKIKFGQTLVCCMANISNMFLPEYWRLEVSSRLFFDFIKMTVYWDLTIFDSWYLPFLIVPYSPFQKMKHWKKTWNLTPVLQIVQKITENYWTCLYLSVAQVWWLHELGFKSYIQKCTLSHVLILIMMSQIL